MSESQSFEDVQYFEESDERHEEEEALLDSILRAVSDDRLEEAAELKGDLKAVQAGDAVFAILQARLQ